MASLRDLSKRLKDYLTPKQLVSAQPWNTAGQKKSFAQDQEGWFRGGKFTPGKQISEFANQQSIKAWSPGGALYEPITKAQQGLQRFTQTPRIELKKPQVQSGIGQTAINLAYGIPESIVNIPRNYAVGIARTGQELGTARREQRPLNLQNLVGGIAPLAESLVDVGTFGGGTIAKNIAKSGAKQTVKQALIKGMAKGASAGGLGGLSYGLDTQYGKDFNAGEVAKSTAGGIVLGGVLGGGISAVPAIRNSVVNAYKKLGVSDEVVETLTKQHFVNTPNKPVTLRLPKAQKDFWAKVNKELGRPLDTPVYQDDLKGLVNKKTGIPDTQLSVGMQVKAKEGLTPELTTTTKGAPQLEMRQQTPESLPKPASQELLTRQQPELPITRITNKQSQISQPFEDIIQQGKKDIGKTIEPEPRSLKQVADDFYTQWVDRYNPLTKATEKAKATLKIKGAELRPESDPTVLARRLTGAGGIADARYTNELKPIINAMDNLNIPKDDMDVYLKARRDIGLSQRGIKGSDFNKASEIVNAVESKYGQSIQDISKQLYDYQNKGFQEMVDAGFISPESANIIRQQNPDYVPFERVMDELDNYLGLPTRKTMQGTQPIAKIKGSERQILSPVESIIANTFKQRAAIEKNKVANSIVNLNKIAPELGFNKVSKSGADTITVWNNGNKEFYRVGQDIADTAKGLNEENMNTLLKIFTAPASLLRQGATGRNPEFMIPNVIRDQLDAGVTSKYGYIPFIDYLSGLKSMLSNDDIYKKWESSGAKLDLGEMSGRKQIQASFDEKVAKKSIGKWLGDVLDVMGKYSEQPTRVGLFKKGYKKTGNELLAMMESRDATVDFARMGSKMKVANSIIPFLNVGVQGFDKLMRSVKNNPGKVALNATIYGAIPALTTTLYNLTTHPEEYAEIPQYEKDSNFVLVSGRNENGTVDYVKIPKGNVLPLISNPIESFLSYASGNNDQSIKEFTNQFISQALPVLGDGQSLKEIATKTIGSNLPQLIKPVAENLLNTSFYKYDPTKEQAKQIVPTYIQNREPYQQSYEWTPAMYKAIGATLNVSPLKVQNLLEGYLAGYTKIPANIIDTLKNVSEGNKPEKNKIPLLRRFFSTTYESSAKPAEKQLKTPLMERLTGKASASESTAGLSDKQIESEKWKFKSSGENAKQVSDGVYFVKSDGGDISTIDISKEIEEPKYTGNTAIDKKLKSQYKGKLTTRGNNIVKLYEAGLIDLEQATALMDEIEIKYDSTSTKKAKSTNVTIKKTTVKTPGLTKSSFKNPPTVKFAPPPVKASVYKAPKNIRISGGIPKKIKVKAFKNTLAVGNKLV